jgi:hypothetical protein
MLTCPGAMCNISDGLQDRANQLEKPAVASAGSAASHERPGVRSPLDLSSAETCFALGRQEITHDRSFRPRFCSPSLT